MLKQGFLILKLLKFAARLEMSCPLIPIIQLLESISMPLQRQLCAYLVYL